MNEMFYILIYEIMDVSCDSSNCVNLSNDRTVTFIIKFITIFFLFVNVYI